MSINQSVYQIVVPSYRFTRWHNRRYGTNYPDDKAVPTPEFNRALDDNNMELVKSHNGGPIHTKYVLRAWDGGVMARNSGLDQC